VRGGLRVRRAALRSSKRPALRFSKGIEEDQIARAQIRGVDMDPGSIQI
jgi:hypothetical protein